MKKDNNNKETHFKTETTETWMKTTLLTQTKCSLEQVPGISWIKIHITATRKKHERET